MKDAIMNSIRTACDCLFESTDLIELRRVPSGKRTWVVPGELEALATDLATENKAGNHIFFGANPRKEVGGSKSVDVACARCLFVDFDDETD